MSGVSSSLPDMLSAAVDQITAVRGAFSLAGYDGELRTLPIASEDERIFVLSQEDVLALRDVRTLEQVLQQLLGRKVWIVAMIREQSPHDWWERGGLRRISCPEIRANRVVNRCRGNKPGP